MIAPHLLQLSAWLLVAAPIGVFGQFDSGSDGSYGPLNLTEDTILQIPDDGIFHCTTITIGNGINIRFSKNAVNTPVYMLATGDVTIGSSIFHLSGDDSMDAAGGEGGAGRLFRWRWRYQ